MMCMIMYSAIAEVGQVSGNDQDHGRDQQPRCIMCYEFFKHQTQKAGAKKNKRKPVVMMFAVTVIQRIAANGKGQCDHAGFKGLILYDIDTE